MTPRTPNADKALNNRERRVYLAAMRYVRRFPTQMKRGCSCPACELMRACAAARSAGKRPKPRRG